MDAIQKAKNWLNTFNHTNIFFLISHTKQVSTVNKMPILGFIWLEQFRLSAAWYKQYNKLLRGSYVYAVQRFCASGGHTWLFCGLKNATLRAFKRTLREHFKNML